MNKRNENRPGYKKTKVGWIPLDWSCESLLRTGAWKGGGTPSKNNANYWDNGTIPWASSQDVKSDVLESTIHHISAAAVTESSTNIIPPNSLIMVTRSGILRHTFPISKTIFDVAINQDIKALLIKEGIHCDFINAVLQFNGKDILRKCAKVGTTVESIEFESLKKYPIPLPNFVEQKNIAEILSAWDRAIEQTRKLIAAKKSLKKGLMQQLLTGRMRFSEFGKPVSQKSDLPVGWRKEKLEEIAEVSFSGVDKKVYRGQTAVKLCNYMDVYNNEYITADLDFMSATASEAEISKFSLIKGDVIITKDSETPEDIGVPAVISEALDNVICGYHLAHIRPNPRLIDSVFLAKLISHDETRNRLARLANGVTRFGLTKSSFIHLEIPCPEIAEQRCISGVLFECDEEIKLLTDEVMFLSDQKKGLMQKLLTGEVRVQLPEKAAS